MSRTTSTSISAPDLGAGFPREAMRKLRELLEPDEQIVWSGQPLPLWRTRALLRSIWLVYATAAFAMLMGVVAKDGIAVSLASACIAALLTAMLYAMHRAATRSLYAVTDRRVLVVEPNDHRVFFGGDRLVVKSYPPHLLQNVETCSLRDDGTGDVILSKRTERDDDGHERVVSEGLLQVRDVRDVERYVRALAATHSANDAAT